LHRVFSLFEENPHPEIRSQKSAAKDGISLASLFLLSDAEGVEFSGIAFRIF